MAPPADAPSMGKLVLLMGLLVLLGAPLLGYVWETINELLALEVDGTRVLITLPVFVVLVGVLMLVARTVRRWMGEPT